MVSCLKNELILSFISLQTFLIWQILFSIIFLGRRYRINQILGCTLVAVGVIVSVARLASSINLLGIILSDWFLCLLSFCQTCQWTLYNQF